MWDLKVCAVCFNTSAKLFNLNQHDLRKQFNLISGLTTCSGGGTPEYLCVECSAYIRKFIKFRDKCQRAHYAFQYLLSKTTEIKKSDLKLLNCEELNVMPSLSYIDLKRVHYKQIEFQCTQSFRRKITPLEFMPILHVSTLTPDDTFESVTNTNKVNLLTDIKEEVSASDINEIKSDEQKPRQNTNKYLTIEVCPLKIAERTFNNDSDDCFNNDDVVLSDTDINNDVNEDSQVDLTSKLTIDVNGSSQNEEYAHILPISVLEAKAVAEINKKVTMQGVHKCDCGWSCNNKKLLFQHSRMHNKHISGNFHCNICDYYYKTNFLLQCHMSDKHMYKFMCKECKEVNFDRIRAKQHFILRHMKRKGNWENTVRPKWLKTKAKKSKLPSKTLPAKVPSLYVNGVKQVQKKYLSFSSIKPEEQYSMVQNRKTTKNYLYANFKCELCYKGFRYTATYEKHMAKHNPDIAGKYQCDVCKLYFPDTRKVYKHIHTNHLVKYSCKLCDFYSTDRGQANLHVSWHQNITYPCPHCDRKFMKLSTQLTHVRIKHPSTFICKLCGHSFVSSHGLFQHLHMTHTKEDLESMDNEVVNTEDPFYCHDCKIQFVNETAFATHMQSSSKHVEVNHATVNAIATERRMNRTITPEHRRGRRQRSSRTDVVNNGISVAQNCDLCGVTLPTDREANMHYKREHPGYDYLKRYMCDVCGHTTRQYANLLAHMRTHTREKPYPCPHCDRKFSMPSNRDRHIVTHTGEKRYQCHQCSRRFTQSNAVKLHIQTVHMKIPYAPWDKKKRKRKKDMEPTTADLNIVAPQTLAHLQPPEHKVLVETNPNEYINAYITYADE